MALLELFIRVFVLIFLTAIELPRWLALVLVLELKLCRKIGRVEPWTCTEDIGVVNGILVPNCDEVLSTFVDSLVLGVLLIPSYWFMTFHGARWTWHARLPIPEHTVVTFALAIHDLIDVPTCWDQFRLFGRPTCQTLIRPRTNTEQTSLMARLALLRNDIPVLTLDACTDLLLEHTFRRVQALVKLGVVGAVAG
jgi:hypothetical protein